MANTTRRMAAMAVMTLGVAATAAANDVRATIVLNIANQCEIRQPVLAAAQETATSLYDVIGVRLVWLPARIAPAPELADALRFRVVLVAEVAQGRLLSVLPLPAAERATVLGMARVDARSAYLFCYRIAKLANLSRINAIEIALGRALAHEIGHLVLPHMVHSNTGIMRASLDLQTTETPRFTETQGASIRTLLLASQ